MKKEKNEFSNDFTQFDIVIDFAKESHVAFISKYYIYSNELDPKSTLRLYIKYYEEKTEIYNFEEADSYFLRYHFYNYNGDNEIILTEDDICKFCLVRITPPGHAKGINSIIRVMLKEDYLIAKPISLEDEIYNKKIKQ